MLSFLRITNLAIIDEVTLEPGPGLNILTGETGAGKSIIVDAIALLLGERGSAELLRSGEDRLVVEGLFDLSGRTDAAVLLRLAGEEGIGEGRELVVRRELVQARDSLKSRAFLNDRLVTLATLRRVGEWLGDIHGQHQHQSLLRADVQRDALDRVSGAVPLREEIAGLFQRLSSLKAERDDLAAREQDRVRREETLERQISEIDAAGPQPGEEEELRREEGLLRHATEVAAIGGETSRLLGDEDDSALSRLASSSEALSRLAAIDPEADRIRQLVDEARVAVEEAYNSLSRYRGRSDEDEAFDPARLESVASRLAELQRLQKKYGTGLEEVLAFREAAALELEDLTGWETRLLELDAGIVTLTEEYLARARELTRKRRTGAASFRRRIEKELTGLAMKGTRVEIGIQSDEDLAGLTGIDEVEFRIAPNAGEEPKPLARIASGGELSRLMLAVRNASGTGGDSRTLVFDEVDSGIGGRTAGVVGERLARLSSDQQLFCVTHLPQIASFADRHYQVSKVSLRGRTRVRVNLLDHSGRIDELARMIGGGKGETARRHAATMVERLSTPGGRSGRRIVS